MFIRIIIFLALVAAISLGLNWLFVNEGSVEFIWLGYKIKTTTTFFILAGSVALFFLILFIQLLIILFSLPRRIRKKYHNHLLEQSLKNLQIGYAALLSGDMEQAKKYSQKLISDPSKNKSIGNLSNMLAAKVAQEEGNTAIAQDYFNKFLENKKQRFFAVKSLLDNAFSQGDIESAMNYAEEAYRLKPNVKAGARSLLELYKKAGRFDRAEEFLKKYKRRHLFLPDKYNDIDVEKELGFIWFAKAKEIFDNDNSIRIKDKANLTEAKKYAEKSLKIDPYNKEIIKLLLLIYRAMKLEGKAKHLIERTWNRVQSLEMGLVYLDSFAGNNPKDSAKKKLKAIQGLETIARNPEIIEKLKDKIYV
jgi:HemY protein